jgi:anti-sigma factor RsiW
VSDRRSPCDRARRLLDERLDRRLTRFEGDALSAHLEACAACRAEAAAAEEVDALLAAESPPEPPPHFTDGVVAALDRAPADGSVAGRPLSAGARVVRGLVAALGTAGFAALAVAVIPAQALAAPFPVPVPDLPAVALPDLPEPVAAILEGASGSLAPPAMLAVALAAAAGAAFVVHSIRSGAARGPR